MQEHLPPGQSFKNFDRMTIAIKLAIDAILLPVVGGEQRRLAYRFDPLRFEHAPLSPETFSARFRDAVRYGVKHRYLSNQFSPQQLVNLESVMEVSTNVEPPFVWVYNKSIKVRFLRSFKGASEAQEQQQPQALSNAQVVSQTSYKLGPLKTREQLHNYLSIKHLITPPIIVITKLQFDLDDETLNNWLMVFDCSILKLDNEREYLIA